MQIINYDAACRALSEAESIDEVRGILDRFTVIHRQAKQAGNKNLAADAFEIRKRAEHRLEILLAERRLEVLLEKIDKKFPDHSQKYSRRFRSR